VTQVPWWGPTILERPVNLLLPGAFGQVPIKRCTFLYVRKIRPVVRLNIPGATMLIPVAVHLLGLRVRMPPGVWMSVVSVVCFQVEVSATGWHSSRGVLPSVVYVIECDHEASIMRTPWLLRHGEIRCHYTKFRRTGVQNSGNFSLIFWSLLVYRLIYGGSYLNLDDYSVELDEEKKPWILVYNKMPD
jgi:hypothetical protein